jgi:hypothetical protein
VKCIGAMDIECAHRCYTFGARLHSGRANRSEGGEQGNDGRGVYGRVFGCWGSRTHLGKCSGAVLRDLMGCYGMLRDVTGCYGTLRDVMGRYGTLQDVTGRYGTLRDVTGSGQYEELIVLCIIRIRIVLCINTYYVLSYPDEDAPVPAHWREHLSLVRFM